MLQPTSTMLCMQYPMYTVMVFDEQRRGIPAAFIITNRETTECIADWLALLKAKAVEALPAFQPTCFMVDDSAAEQAAIRCVVFPSSPACLAPPACVVRR